MTHQKAAEPAAPAMSNRELDMAHELALKIAQWADKQGRSLPEEGYPLPFYAQDGSAVLDRTMHKLSPRFRSFTVKIAGEIQRLHFTRK